MLHKLTNHPPELSHLEYICGIDEVGRGTLSGPVVAASVILPKNFTSELIRDSKKLTEKKRLLAFEEIKNNVIDWSVSFVSPEIIDDINIQQATFLAMHNSIEGLSKVKPDHLLIDGNGFNEFMDIPYTCVIKGDDTYYCIAAASIVAKVIRDQYMSELDSEYPEYGWKSNKGYGSKSHIESIQKIGVTKHHRKSFLKNIV